MEHPGYNGAWAEKGGIQEVVVEGTGIRGTLEEGSFALSNWTSVVFPDGDDIIAPISKDYKGLNDPTQGKFGL